jgi:hypothetical protein
MLYLFDFFAPVFQDIQLVTVKKLVETHALLPRIWRLCCPMIGDLCKFSASLFSFCFHQAIALLSIAVVSFLDDFGNQIG